MPASADLEMACTGEIGEVARVLYGVLCVCVVGSQSYFMRGRSRCHEHRFGKQTESQTVTLLRGCSLPTRNL